MVWSAVYAAEWRHAQQLIASHGISPSVPTCVENAWAAVVDMRNSRNAIIDGWGDENGDSDELVMLDAILGKT